MCQGHELQKIQGYPDMFLKGSEVKSIKNKKKPILGTGYNSFSDKLSPRGMTSVPIQFCQQQGSAHQL